MQEADLTIVEAMTLQFSDLLRQLRTEHSWSLRDLSERICYHRAYIGKVEQGEKFPDRKFAALADQALSARGSLIEAWHENATAREAAARTGRLLETSATESLRLLHAETDADADALHEAADLLAVDYLSTPPGPMLEAGVELRAQLVNRLERKLPRTSPERRELFRILGHVQGVLTYAALDLGHADIALTHAATGWMCAEQANDDELKVWIRGTQSLALRFQSRYDEALRILETVEHYRTPGTGHLRILAGIAQCHANLGDSAGANAALDQALHERQTLRSRDEAPGLFEFSQAKQFYYSGSSLMWLPEAKDSKRAAIESGRAIDIWEHEPVETRSLDDEALAHVYQATALMKLGRLDEASATVQPIIDLPEDRQISWISRRLGDLANQTEQRFPNSREASELVQTLRDA